MSDATEAAELKRQHAADLLAQIKMALDVVQPQTVEEVHWLLNGMIEQAAKPVDA